MYPYITTFISFPSNIRVLYVKNYCLNIRVLSNNLFSLLYFFKFHSVFRFDTLIDIVVTDVIEKLKRFTICYLFQSHCFNFKLRMFTRVKELGGLMSICSLYNSGGWIEREIWDMFGIKFYEHPELKRLLTDYGFSGFPLRKDFPVTGFLEIFFREVCGRLSYRAIVLSQEFRIFLFDNAYGAWTVQRWSTFYDNYAIGVQLFTVVAEHPWESMSPFWKIISIKESRVIYDWFYYVKNLFNFYEKISCKFISIPLLFYEASIDLDIVPYSIIRPYNQ